MRDRGVREHNTQVVPACPIAESAHNSHAPAGRHSTQQTPTLAIRIRIRIRIRSCPRLLHPRRGRPVQHRQLPAPLHLHTAVVNPARLERGEQVLDRPDGGLAGLELGAEEEVICASAGRGMGEGCAKKEFRWWAKGRF